MEEDRLLGPCRCAVALILVAFLFSSCSIPRIAILKDPLTPEEHVNLGVSYEKRGELDAALEEYRAATKAMPLAYLYVGNVYFQRKAYSDAEKAYRKAIDKTNSAEACNNLAWLYYTTGSNLDEAEALARKAVELSPESEDFKDTLTKIEERRRQ
ncbi:MAG TPA: tetratricopeptide repeat protein [Syntrophorhabdales bacterium]|nr:tetratricopeptide repeat protein [Syntrophorhabdales bacterium]